jgi:hypothetical protein
MMSVSCKTEDFQIPNEKRFASLCVAKSSDSEIQLTFLHLSSSNKLFTFDCSSLKIALKSVSINCSVLQIYYQ